MSANPDHVAAYPDQRGTLTLRATVDARAEHHLEHFLEQLRELLANHFSCAVHDYYPDARVSCEVEVRTGEQLAEIDARHRERTEIYGLRPDVG